MTYAIGKVAYVAHVNDPRFTATLGKVKPGLAVFLRDVIRVYCTANGA